MSDLRSIAVSWVLFSIRETIGFSIVRNSILKKKIDKLGRFSSDIVYGKTFSQGDTFDDIHNTVKSFRNTSKRFLIFTSNGEIVENKRKKVRFSDEIESHYVSFIVDSQKMETIIVDPSRDSGQVGIYNPYIGICLTPFFKELGYKVRWLEMTSPCQITYNDVFCQSWTLYLVYKWLKNSENTTITIPRKQVKKYSVLLRFYKNALKYRVFCEELDLSYRNNIKGHDQFESLNRFDPSELLFEMSAEDMD
jgi:hypothetical protein